MTDYNIKSGTPLTIKTQHEFITYQFHPYGLSGFREEILDFIEEKKKKGLSYSGYDNLTHAWRTPWDVHVRYHELMGPLNHYVTSISKQLSPESDWYHHDAWIAQYENCSGANLHNHGDTLGWSYCYYVKVPDEGPGFMIKDGASGDLLEINVTDGDILFFRSFIDHQVLPSNGERVIVSGNLRVLDRDFNFLEQSLDGFDTENWAKGLV